MFRNALAIAAAVGVGLCAGPARADLIRTFAASGTFSQGVTLSGTETIDVTTGVVTAADLKVGAPDNFTFTYVASQGTVDGDLATSFYEASGQLLPELILAYDTSGNAPASLVGYDGGKLSSVADPFQTSSKTVTSTLERRAGESVALESGELTPLAEPTALAVFAVGTFGLWFIWSRRRS